MDRTRALDYREREPIGCKTMFRVLFRITGILALAGAFVALVVDGTRSIAAGQISMARLGDPLQQALGPKFANLQPLIERNISPLLWDPVLVRLLLVPTWVALMLLGCLLILATRQRRAKIGFATRP